MLRAPTAGARDAALARLTWEWGASPLYPASLDRVEALRPHRADTRACPGARDLAARLLTLRAGVARPSADAERLAGALRKAERAAGLRG